MPIAPDCLALAGSTALVTGAARGLNAAIADAFARYGAEPELFRVQAAGAFNGSDWRGRSHFASDGDASTSSILPSTGAHLGVTLGTRAGGRSRRDNRVTGLPRLSSLAQGLVEFPDQMRLLPLMAALTFLPGVATAEPGECDQLTTFCVPLPDLVGVIDFLPSGAGRHADFDVGQQFSEIENVWIEVEAHVFAKEFDVCGTSFDPQACVHHIQLLGFLSIMDEDSPNPGFVWSEGLWFSDNFRALEGCGVDVAIFNNNLVGWDFLLNGKGGLTLWWNDASGDPDRIILNVIEPSGEIFDARLIIEGTPVPEPSAGTLAGASLLVLASMRRWMVHRSCRTTSMKQ